jgi:RNA polymerase sigma-70 factor, ECF subfamily
VRWGESPGPAPGERGREGPCTIVLPIVCSGCLCHCEAVLTDLRLPANLIEELDRSGVGSLAAAHAALDAASCKWPGLPSPDDFFVNRLRQHLAPGPVEDALAAIDIGEMLLAHHAMLGNQMAVAEVHARIDALRGPLRRTGASSAEIEELLADLLADLVGPRSPVSPVAAGSGDDGPQGDHAPRIAGFAGRCSLKAWMQVIAVRRMVVRRRKRGEVLSDDLFADVACEQLDPELLLIRHTYAYEFCNAFAEALRNLDPTERLILRQHHLDGVGLDGLARLHDVHRATIARRLAATREKIFATIRRTLLRDLKVGNETLDSILRVVRSEMDLSLIRLL